MKRTNYQDGIEVGAGELNNTESQKSASIKERNDSFTQKGVLEGLRVTKNVTITISSGIGYCGNGERIEVESDITGVVVTGGQYNFICLIFIETDSNVKPHESTGTSYTTRAEESYSVIVLSESEYESLSSDEKDNRIVVAIEKDGVIQQSKKLDEEITSTHLNIQGISLLKYSPDTPYGRSWFYYEWKASLDMGWIYYKVVGDSYGSVVYLNTDGDYLLTSLNGNDTCWIRVGYEFLPEEDAEVFTEVQEFYDPPKSSGIYDTELGSSKDRLHRGSTGDGLPRVENAHGVLEENLAGGGSGVVVHQRMHHTTCIVSKAWFSDSSSNTLKPYINNMYISIQPLPLNDRFFIQGEEFDEVLSSSILMSGSGLRYVGLNKSKQLVSSIGLSVEVLPLCSVFVSGGFLADFVDMRIFGSRSEISIQDKAITTSKLYNESIKKRHLWLSSDTSSVELLVNSEQADALHAHFDHVAYWKTLYYQKTLLSHPQATVPDNPGAEDYDGSEWRGCDLPGGEMIGAVIDSMPSVVGAPDSYKDPGQTEAVEYNVRGIARVVTGDADSLQEAIDYLASVGKILKDRDFGGAVEVMDTSGRMLNLTFVPLPDNHLSGNWADGSPVEQSECSWIVSPAFLMGLGGFHIPFLWLNSTFGLGTGGDWDPTGDWDWAKWIEFGQMILNGNIMYGRWLVQLIITSANDIIGSLLSVYGTHANYHIIGSHQYRLDGEDNFMQGDAGEYPGWGGDANTPGIDDPAAIGNITLGGDTIPTAPLLPDGTPYWPSQGESDDYLYKPGYNPGVGGLIEPTPSDEPEKPEDWPAGVPWPPRGYGSSVPEIDEE